MKRRFKLLAVLVGVAAVIAVVVVIIVPALIDSSHYKRQVMALV